MQLIVRIFCGCRWCTENWRLKIWSSKGTVLLIHPQLHMKYSYGQNVFITHKSICRDLRSLFKALHVQHYVIRVQSAQSVNKNDKDASLTTEAAENTYKHVKPLTRDKVSILTNTPLWFRSNTALQIINIHSFSLFDTQLAVFLVYATQCRLSKRYAMLHSTTALQTQNTIKTPQLPNIKLMSGSYFIPKSKGKNKKLYFWHF